MFRLSLWVIVPVAILWVAIAALVAWQLEVLPYLGFIAILPPLGIGVIVDLCTSTNDEDQP